MLVKTFQVEATGSACVLIAFDVLSTRNDCTFECVLTVFTDGNLW